jgi:hypothetical protein
MLRAVLVAASIGATALYGLLQPDDIGTLLAHPTHWDGRHVKVVGTIAKLEERTALDGRDYDAFDLCDSACIHVFAGGHPTIREGQSLTVQGTFSAAQRFDTFAFQNDIEADEGSL